MDSKSLLMMQNLYNNNITIKRMVHRNCVFKKFLLDFLPLIACMVRFLANPVSIHFWLVERVWPFAFAFVRPKESIRSSNIIGHPRRSPSGCTIKNATRKRVEF